MTADDADRLLAELKEGLADKVLVTVNYKDRTIRYSSQEEIISAIRQLGGEDAVRRLDEMLKGMGLKS